MNDQSKKELNQKRLRRLYGPGKSELNFLGEYQLVVSVMLSATDDRQESKRNNALLFARYPSFAALSRAKVSINRRHYSADKFTIRRKPKHLREMAVLVAQSFDSALPRTHEELISLPGVGNKTANVVVLL